MRSLVALCALALALVTGCSSDASEPGTASPEPAASSPDSASASGSGAAYVAMGDSYTSAAGVPDVVDAGCFRSSVNYPTLVAAELDLTLDDVSCGGASTASLTGPQETAEGPVPPQLEALTSETELVTLGIGGNEESLFSELLFTCLGLRDKDPDGAPCRDALNEGGSDRALDTIELIQERVTASLADIRERAPEARVVLVGYPQLVPAEGACDSLPLTPLDYEYLRGVLVSLGEATESAAADADVEYVDLLTVSEGHDICAGADAWVNGILATEGRTAMVMHPFAEEQAAIAALVVEVAAEAEDPAGG